MDNQPMTPGQLSFLTILCSVVGFAVGNVLIGFANMDQASHAWGMVGGVLFLASPVMFIAGCVLGIMSLVHDRRDRLEGSSS